jgi:hypothetical protein
VKARQRILLCVAASCAAFGAAVAAATAPAGAATGHPTVGSFVKTVRTAVAGDTTCTVYVNEMNIYGNADCQGAAYDFRGTNHWFGTLTAGAGCENEETNGVDPVNWNDCVSSYVNDTLGEYTFYDNVNCGGEYVNVPEGAYNYNLEYEYYDNGTGNPANDSFSSDNAGAFLPNGCAGVGH